MPEAFLCVDLISVCHLMALFSVSRCNVAETAEAFFQVTGAQQICHLLLLLISILWRT